MMTPTMSPNEPFLRHVARDILRRYGEDLSQLTIVFPNKRAALFINEQFATLSSKPVWSPSYTSISEMFRTQGKSVVADDIKLICDLYRSFSACTGSSESLDQFYGWGSVLLADFDDIDKSMANAQGIFANLRDLRYYDNLDYLNEEQNRVLKFFFKDFDEHQNSKLKEKFLNLWSKLGDVYKDFNRRLDEQNISYEGKLYRSVIEDDTLTFGDGRYIFVGFNALLEVERHLFRRLRQEGKAEFYWDFDRYYMSADTTSPNAPGHFVARYLNEFPNQLDNEDDSIYDHLEHDKHIVFTGAPTDSIQARYLGQWLQDERRVKAGNRTAVVLCNERLLPTVIHSIPNSVSELNITTGYPLMQTAATSLVRQLLDLISYGRAGNDKYRQKFVTSVLRHPYAYFISPLATSLSEQLITDHRYYPRREELTGDEGLQDLFRDLSISNSGKEYNIIYEVNAWLLDLLRRVALNASQNGAEDPLTHESLFRTYTLVNRLHNLIDSGDLTVDFVTYQRLLSQLISSTTIPFHGEPAVGLQVMGVLETRNLDFDHLLILSCNEGNMPKGIDTPSFIPQSIRKAFGLTTIDQKTGIYAYYFFRMLQRATDVTIMYGNAADDKNTGEKSRFMLQLMVESSLDIQRQAIHSVHSPNIRQLEEIEKTGEVARRLADITHLSPTAISQYLRCPLIFFYKYVAGLRELEDESEEIDNRIFGNIFHDASQYIYDELTGVDRTAIDSHHPFAGQGHVLTKCQIDYALKNPGVIERNLDKAFAYHLFKTEDKRHLPEYNGMQIINRKVIYHYLRQLLKVDYSLAPLTIRGLEGDVFGKISVITTEGVRKVGVGGRIDRLDEITDANGQKRIRVVDYKTGHKVADDPKEIAAIFDPDNIPGHSDYYLQSMLYSMLVSRSHEINPMGKAVSPALLFIQHAGAANYTPILKLDKEEIADMRLLNDEFESCLSALVGEILEPTLPFRPIADKKRCHTCAYQAMCGSIKDLPQ